MLNMLQKIRDALTNNLDNDIRIFTSNLSEGKKYDLYDYHHGWVDGLKYIKGHINEYTNVEEKILDEEPTKEAVDHPQHYNRKGAMECIDEMRLIFGDDETAIFCKLNAYKYRYRAGSKGNAKEDLRKSDWYIKKYKELRDKPCGYINTTDNSNITLLSNHTKD